MCVFSLVAGLLNYQVASISGVAGSGDSTVFDSTVNDSLSGVMFGVMCIQVFRVECDRFKNVSDARALEDNFNQFITGNYRSIPVVECSVGFSSRMTS